MHRKNLAWPLLVLILLAGAAPPGEPLTTSDRLEQAIYTEETVGDLDAAMKLYRRIAASADSSRGVAAHAQYRLGLCHLQRGEREEAARALRELVERYPEEHVLLALARRQLPSTTADEPLTLAEGVEPHDELDELAVRYAEAWRRLDATALADLYLPDVFILQPDAEIQRGSRDQELRVRQYFDLFQLNGIRPLLTSTIVAREVFDEVAYDVGYFSLVLPIDGTDHTLRGKFATVYRRDDDGAWKIRVEVTNELPERLSDLKSMGALMGLIFGSS